jgi:lysine-N-methylase
MCSLLDHDMLCSIQKQLGRELLPTACSIFPRSISKVDGELEVSLSLSCPEAARNVLLDETFIDQVGDCRGGEFRVDNVFSLKRHPVSQKLGFEFSAIRRAVIGVIRDRAESLEVRLLKIGALCRNLDDVSRISDIEIALDRLAGRIPSDVFNLTRNNVSARIQLAFDLSSPHLDDPANSRFPEVFLWFAQGLSSTSPLQKISDIERFSAAAREFYTPFIISRPHILENYLINYILQTLFPFGREGSSDFFTLTAWDEYVQMVVRYVWVTTLLTGIAGHLRAGFSEAHIIQTVQSLTRSIEHYPRVLASLSEYLTMTNRDHLTGVAELLASDQ